MPFFNPRARGEARKTHLVSFSVLLAPLLFPSGRCGPGSFFAYSLGCAFRACASGAAFRFAWRSPSASARTACPGGGCPSCPFWWVSSGSSVPHPPKKGGKSGIRRARLRLIRVRVTPACVHFSVHYSLRLSLSLSIALRLSSLPAATLLQLAAPTAAKQSIFAALPQKCTQGKSSILQLGVPHPAARCAASSCNLCRILQLGVQHPVQASSCNFS